MNKKGWWGILLHATWPTLLAIILTAVVFTLVESFDAGLSALVAGLIVWALSAVSILLIAVVWKNHRDMAIPIAMGAFVAKLVFIGFLLAIIPAPAWLHSTGAAVGALVAIVIWQVGEILVFINTRRLIYW
ncbi:MAG TPA: hypothetical protein H9884_08540 [Candidatus Yaniella excrementigallinarum]|nr:hypothetical protein [Candidatus Yaniella excrementigallinarum]